MSKCFKGLKQLRSGAEKNFENRAKKIKKTLAKFDKLIYTKKACLRR